MDALRSRYLSSVLDDMAEMQKIQAQGSQTKYNNTLKTINQTYGANFQPVKMDELNGPRPNPTKGAFSWDNMPEHK